MASLKSIYMMQVLRHICKIERCSFLYILKFVHSYSQTSPLILSQNCRYWAIEKRTNLKTLCFILADYFSLVGSLFLYAVRKYLLTFFWSPFESELSRFGITAFQFWLHPFVVLAYYCGLIWGSHVCS